MKALQEVFEWEKDWKETLAKPLLETRRRSGILLAVLTGSMGISVVLLAALSMRKKKEEIDILTALGEKKYRLCLQNVIEELFPVVLALVIVSFVGNISVDRIGKAMTEKNIAVTNKINQKETELMVWEYEDLYLGTTLNRRVSAAGNIAQVRGDLQVPVTGIFIFAGTVLIFVTVIVILQTRSMGRKAMRRDGYE